MSCSQGPATGPYPKTGGSSSRPHTKAHLIRPLGQRSSISSLCPSELGLKCQFLVFYMRATCPAHLIHLETLYSKVYGVSRDFNEQDRGLFQHPRVILKTMTKTTKQIGTAGKHPAYTSTALRHANCLLLVVTSVLFLYAVGHEYALVCQQAAPGLRTVRPTCPRTQLSPLVRNVVVIAAYQWDLQIHSYTACLLGHVVWTRQSSAHFRLRAQNKEGKTHNESPATHVGASVCYSTLRNTKFGHDETHERLTCSQNDVKLTSAALSVI